MKATPIAEFLARKAAPAEEPAVNPLNARKVSAVNDDREPEFRRSGLAATLARRAPPTLVRPIDPAAFAPRRDAPQRDAPRREASRRDAPEGETNEGEPPASDAPQREPTRARALRAATPRAAEAFKPLDPQGDWEAKLAEAYHRGVQEGLDAGVAEAATARALERAELQKRAVVDKLDFQMNEFARLAETLGAGFNELERRIAEAAARLLKPLVQEHVARELVEELAQNVGRMARGGGAGLLKIRGPERLLSALKEKIGSLAVDAEYVEDEGVEISVSAKATEIRSELAAWGRLIDDVVENG